MKFCSADHQLGKLPHDYLSGHELEEGFREARQSPERPSTHDPQASAATQTMYSHGSLEPFDDAGPRNYQPEGDGERYDCVEKAKGTTGRRHLT